MSIQSSVCIHPQYSYVRCPLWPFLFFRSINCTSYRFSFICFSCCFPLKYLWDLSVNSSIADWWFLWCWDNQISTTTESRVNIRWSLPKFIRLQDKSARSSHVSTKPYMAIKMGVSREDLHRVRSRDGVIIVDHGSRRRESNLMLSKLLWPVYDNFIVFILLKPFLD